MYIYVCLCVCVLVCLFVWAYHNYCLCLWPLRANVIVALREQNTGSTLRTWGTWVDVRGLTESKGLRPGPTQTLTYCFCCLRHCVLENKSFGGDTGSVGYNWAATKSWAFCYISHVCFRFRSCWNYTVSLTIFLLYFFSLPCHLPVFSLKWFPTRSNNKVALNVR